MSIQYTGGTRLNNIDLLTGCSTSSGSEDLSSSSETYTASIPEDAYADGVDETSGTKTLVVDYLMTDYVDEQTTINFTYTATLSDETVKTLDITTPIQRNYLTTVTGALLGGTETTVTITCSALDDFNEGEKTVTIEDEEEEEEEEEETVSYKSYTAILSTVIYTEGTTTYYGYYSSESATSYTWAYFENYDDNNLTGSDRKTYTLSDDGIYNSDGNKVATVVTTQSAYDGTEVVKLTRSNNYYEFTRDDDVFAIVITGNPTKYYEAKYTINVDGSSYDGIKCGNLQQNTLYLPDDIYVTQVTFYTYNTGQKTSDGSLVTAYWSEFNGSAFTSEHNNYTDTTVDSSDYCEEPAVATFTSGTEFEGELTGSVTFTNANSQPAFVIKVTYNKHEVEESTGSTEEE